MPEMLVVRRDDTQEIIAIVPKQHRGILTTVMMVTADMCQLRTVKLADVEVQDK